MCVLIVFADAITEHGMDGEYVSLLAVCGNYPACHLPWLLLLGSA